MASAIMTTTVLLVNLMLTIWACLHYGLNDGIGDAYEGDCGTVNVWSTGLHVLINALSSAIFGASNYTMQCLTAPSREECDTAHARRDWLDIGVPSIRNLTRIGWHRRVAWTLLALSSIPIHVFYNSAVFKQLDNNSETHNKVLISPQFLEATDIDFTVFEFDYGNRTSSVNRTANLQLWYERPVASQLHGAYLSDESLFDKLEREECSKVYGQAIMSGYSHLLVVLNATADYENLAVDTGSYVQFWPNGSTIEQWRLDGDVPMAKIWPNWTEIGLGVADAERTPYFW